MSRVIYIPLVEMSHTFGMYVPLSKLMTYTNGKKQVLESTMSAGDMYIHIEHDYITTYVYNLSMMESVANLVTDIIKFNTENTVILTYPPREMETMSHVYLGKLYLNTNQFNIC